MQKLLVLVFLVLVCLGNAQVCYGEECEFNPPPLGPEKVSNPREIANAINVQLRRSYWYYIQDSRLLSASVLDIPERLIFFYFHQGAVGTFLTITSWYKDTGISQINTMVRIGNGKLGVNASSFNFDLQSIKLNLSIDQALRVELADEGQIDINQNLIQFDLGDPKTPGEICKEMSDKYLRETFWYYLRGAAIIDSRTLSTNTRQYVILTYINIVGTFLVISSCDQSDQVHANTFVRLGRGGSPTNVLN